MLKKEVSNSRLKKMHVSNWGVIGECSKTVGHFNVIML